MVMLGSYLIIILKGKIVFQPRDKIILLDDNVLFIYLFIIYNK